MILTKPSGEPLDTYYANPRGQNGGIDTPIKANKCGLSPYDKAETFYYFGKHLALPGIAGGVLIPLVILFGIYENSFLDNLSYIIYGIAAVLLLSVGREYLRGLKYKIKKGVIYLPGPYYFKREAEDYSPCINKITRTKYTIGFIGDIMKMNDFDLSFHPDIISFFKDTDLIIGNLEGILINKSCPKLKQAHSHNILTQLESLLSDKTKLLLCLSNNHSEDFSSTLYNQTVQTIQDHSDNFNVFGRKDVSFICNQEKDLYLASATQWSNQKTWDYTFKYTNPEIDINNYIDDVKYPFRLIRNNNYNILFPHWGFENEKYVRTRFQKDAKALLTGKWEKYTKKEETYRTKFNKGIFAHPNHKWDLIFAHHPHVLQPIMKVTDELVDDKRKKFKINKLVVFSAGNFTSGANIIRKKKHISGIIMKCEIGPLRGHEEKLVVGRMEWRRTKNFKARVNDKPIKRVCIDNEKYRTYNKPFLINGLLFFVMFLVLYLFNLFF